MSWSQDGGGMAGSQEIAESDPPRQVARPWASAPGPRPRRPWTWNRQWAGPGSPGGSPTGSATTSSGATSRPWSRAGWGTSTPRGWSKEGWHERSG